MVRRIETAVALALALGLVPTLAAAKPIRRHKAHVVRSHPSTHHLARRSFAQPRYVDPNAMADGPYDAADWSGAAIRAQARINQAAPGVTNELAPENKATATGGPSGGIPGFSGH